VLVKKATAKAEGEGIKKIKSRLPPSKRQASTCFVAKKCFYEKLEGEKKYYY
jgi:hypothetical protein